MMGVILLYVVSCVAIWNVDCHETNGLMPTVHRFRLDNSGNSPVNSLPDDLDLSNNVKTWMGLNKRQHVTGDTAYLAGVHLKSSPEHLYTKTVHKKFKKPRQSNVFLSEGWGAFGMPFNVLYTPNTHQQKILKSSPKMAMNLAQDKGIKGGPARTMTTTTTTTVRKMPEVLYFLLDDQKPISKPEEKNLKRPLQRKYYSLIPQLFVSYGW